MNEQETNKVWRGLLDAERFVRYYGRLAEKFSRWNRIALSVIAVLTSGAAVLMLAELPAWADGWAPPSLAILAAALAFWLSYADYSRRAGIAAGIAVQCMELAQEWEELWLDADAPAPDVSARAKELSGRMIRVTSLALQQHGFEDRNSTSAARMRLTSICRLRLPTDHSTRGQAAPAERIHERQGYRQGYPPRESPPPPPPPRPGPSPQPRPSQR